jgi:cell wall-associated NlpC family hydrolase
VSAVDQIIAAAQAQIGVPYVFGAADPGVAFDCSGLTQWAYSTAGITLPRTAAEQERAASAVASPMPGDLVFWGETGNADHVALYVGDGKVISAPQPGENVKLQDLWGTPRFGRVSGAGVVTQPVVDLFGDVGGWAKEWTGDLFGGVRDTAVQGLMLVVGLAFVGVGLYVAVGRESVRRGNAKLDQVRGIFV